MKSVQKKSKTTLSARTPKPKLKSSSPRPKLSIIVCSFEGASRIGDCIDALTKQTISEKIEIIVVDDGSSDSTTFLASALLENKNTRYNVITLSENQGLSAARNAGVAASSAPLIAFTDDDCVPEPEWAAKILAAWSRASSTTHGIGGDVIAHSTDTYNRRFLDAARPLRAVESGTMNTSLFAKLKNYLLPRRSVGTRNVDSFVGANMSFRRSSIKAVKGFDPSIRFGGDEQYLCAQLIAAYGPQSLLLEPEILINHQFHPSLRDTLRRSQAYGFGNGRNWASSGGFPSLLPAPLLLILSSALTSILSPLLAPLTFISLLLLLGRNHIQAALQNNSFAKPPTSKTSLLEILTYPFVNLLTEVFDNIGFIRSVFTTRSPRTRFLGGWLWLLLASTLSLLDLGWPGQAVVLFTLILLPGSSILSLLGYRPADLTARLLTATGVGLTFNMFLGLLSSYLAPLLGVNRPLDTLPSTSTFLLVAILLLLFTRSNRDPLHWLRGENFTILPLRWLAPLLLLPALSALAALRLNNNGSGLPAFIITILITLLLLTTTFYTWSKTHNWPVEAILASTSLSLLWSTTLRGYGLFGWDIQKELGIGNQTVLDGIWQVPTNGDAYASMLSLTILPAQFNSIAGISVQTTLRWVFPVFLSLTAAGILAAARRRSNPGPALLALLIAFVATPSFARQIPAIGRQEIAFLLVASLLLAVVDHTTSLRSRRMLATLSGVGLAYSHYTSAYVTSFFLILVMILVPLITRRSKSSDRVLTFGVCLLIVGSTFLWNGVLTRPGTELTEAQVTLTNTGVRLLDNEENNPLKIWLGGTGVQQTSFENYREAVIERRDKLGWVVPDPRSATTTLSDSTAPVLTGALPQLKGSWYLGTALLRQLVTLLIVLALIWYLRRVIQRHPEFQPELFSLAVGAFIVAATLRISSTAAELYNPERAAIHAGLIFSLILATLFSRHLNRLSAPSLLATLLIFGAWGLSLPAFGGAPLASHSKVGEDVERYVTTPADGATASWIASSLPYSANVHTDRYGRVILLSHEFGDKFTIIDVVDPVGVDVNGYIFFTSMNSASMRVRGQIGDDFAVFSSPENFYAQTRSIVYATEETRVYR